MDFITADEIRKSEALHRAFAEALDARREAQATIDVLQQQLEDCAIQLYGAEALIPGTPSNRISYLRGQLDKAQLERDRVTKEADAAFNAARSAMIDYDARFAAGLNGWLGYIEREYEFDEGLTAICAASRKAIADLRKVDAPLAEIVNVFESARAKITGWKLCNPVGDGWRGTRYPNRLSIPRVQDWLSQPTTT